MRVLCFGAGAIGSLIGARLSESGVAVTLLARRDHVAAIRTHGLIVETPQQRIVCKGVDSITMLDDLSSPPDIILLTVKSYDTRDALESLRPLVQRRTVVASLQNGVGNEEVIAAVCGAERTMAGTVTINASRPRPGVVRQHSRGGGIGVAPVDPRQDAFELAALFRRAGIPAAAYRNFRAMKWSKLLLNVFTNATSAILDLSPLDVIEDPRLFEVEREALREAMRVMEALRLRPVALPGYAAPLLRLAVAAPPWLVRPLLRRYIRRGRGTSLPSLWQDLERGRARSEVEVLNGAVAREGSRLGVPTPVNAALAALVQGLAGGRLDRGGFRQQPGALLAAIADTRSGGISTHATSSSARDAGSVVTARPSVSAIIATRNRAELLREALDSIYAQEGLGTRFDVEVVVVDDASTDDTAQVVARYPEVRFIRLPVNQGHPTARNLGINSSSGTYVAFLDDDDVWLPRKLISQVAALEAHPEAGVAYSPFIISAGGQQSVFPEGPAPSGMVFNQLLFVNLCGIPAGPLVRRTVLERVGGFSQDLGSVEDYDLWLRLSFHAPFIFVPGLVAVYRQTSKGNMLTTLRSGAYDRTFGLVIERALALLPDTEETRTLKHRVRANRELRIAALLKDNAQAWERLRAGVTMWPELVLNPGNQLSIAHIIAEHAVSADSPFDAATRLWKEIDDLQRGLGRGDKAAMRRLLATAYWRVGVIEGKGIGRPANARKAVRAIVRSIMLDPLALRRWCALLGFLAGRPFVRGAS